MKLQTQIPLPPEMHNQMDYHSKVALFGSCFVENIGEKFNYYKFQNLQNPFGILFHPLAIEALITNAINEKVYSEADIFFHNEQWHCYETHSKLSHTSKDEILLRLNTAIQQIYKFLQDASHIIITLGTAWVYRHIESDTVVGNCHKVPQKQFAKELLPIDIVSESLQAIVSLIKSVNPKASILFTVSPVRHIKDGFIQNTQSKAHLIAAIHQVIEPKNQLFYFPSYEIMLDELRDYRFYNDDMLHPNQVAVTYIWNKFQDVWISEKASKTMETVEAIQKGLQHKPFNQNSEAHQKFRQHLESKKKSLYQEFSHISF